MQEAGVPVTFAYISDAHDCHGVAGEIHHAYGPGEAGYVQQLAGLRQGLRRLLHPPEERRDHEGQHAVRVHRRGRRPLRRHAAGQRRVRRRHARRAPTPRHVTEVNGDLKRLVATYNASHGTAATTNFSVHSDMAPNVYITGNPARDSADGADARAGDVRHGGDESATRANSRTCSSPWPIRSRRTSSTWSPPTRRERRRSRRSRRATTSSTRSSTTPCANNDLNCVSCRRRSAAANQSFAWNHGGIQPEIRDDVDRAGSAPGSRSKTARADDGCWTDHTDIRPTMLALLGLKDTYVSDGRVVTEFLKGDATPKALNGTRQDVEELGAAYKQIIASFGQFSLDTLCGVDGRAREHIAGDTTYTATETALQSSARTATRSPAQIRMALWNAEFNGQEIDEKQAKDWIEQANDLLDRASALAASFDVRLGSKELGKINHIVVIYEENHSFDNLFGGWEGVNGLTTSTRRASATTSRRSTRTARVRLPQAARRQPHLAPAREHVPGRGARDHVASNFPNTFFTIDDFIKPSDVTCPPITNAFGSRTGSTRTTRPAGARPGGCTRDLVHEYYQEQYQLHGGMQDRYMSGSDSAGTTMGVYDTTQLPIYKYLHEKGHPDYAIADDFFQAAFGGSFLNHQWLIAAATPVDPTGSTGGAMRAAIRSSTRTGCRRVSALHADDRSVGAQPADRRRARLGTLRRPHRSAATGPSTRCSRRTSRRARSARSFPLQTAPTIGDRLSAAGVDWAWYSGGWANATGDIDGPGLHDRHGRESGNADGLFDPTVDPAPSGVPVAHWPRVSGRALPVPPSAVRLLRRTTHRARRDGAPAGRGRLPGPREARQDAATSRRSASSSRSARRTSTRATRASRTAAPPRRPDQSIEGSACAKDTMVIVTYDEFGGQWDHVSPPGQGNDNGPHDVGARARGSRRS